ncbi:MAG TPA: PAAR-like domain-containing protein [Myxococcaceae bacterium]|nr:PAAR-like domain-containing protein [Myxococcaceae bacterium]
MAVNTGVNKMSVVTKDSNGTTVAFPDVCKTKGKAEFVNFSFDVKFEGRNVARAFDLMLHNDKNTPPFPVMQGPVIAMGKDAGKTPCIICDEEV